MSPYGPYGPIYSNMSGVKPPIYSHMSRVIPPLLTPMGGPMGAPRSLYPFLIISHEWQVRVYPPKTPRARGVLGSAMAPGGPQGIPLGRKSIYAHFSPREMHFSRREMGINRFSAQWDTLWPPWGHGGSQNPTSPWGFGGVNPHLPLMGNNQERIQAPWGPHRAPHWG